jgi:replicative DNA helicase
MSEKPTSFESPIHDMDGREMPQNLDAERSVLGSILLDPGHFFEAAEAIADRDFYLPAHRWIFKRMRCLAEAGHTIDYTTLADELFRYKELVAVGGVAYICGLPDGMPRRPSIADYVRIVKEKSRLREIMLSSRLTFLNAADQTESAAALVEAADRELLNIVAEESDRLTIGQQSEKELEKLLAQAKGEYPPALSTGIRKLDEKIGGITRGELTVLAARPGQGKSFLSTNYSSSIAAKACAALDCGLDDQPPLGAVLPLGLRVIGRKRAALLQVHRRVVAHFFTAFFATGFFCATAFAAGLVPATGFAAAGIAAFGGFSQAVLASTPSIFRAVTKSLR